MKLFEFEISNQSRFLRTGRQALGPRRTAIVGQNNVGKSALLRALAPDAGMLPLRTSDDSPEEISSRKSRIERKYCFSLAELEECCQRNGLFHAKTSASLIETMRPQFVNKSYQGMFLTCTVSGDKSSSSESYALSLDLETQPKSPFATAIFQWNETSKRINITSAVSPDSIELRGYLIERARSAYHRFGAERLGISSSSVTKKEDLLPNCENLPSYLDHISPNPEWSDLQSLLKSIIPSISRLSVRPNPDDGTIREIVLWTSSRPRGDLAIPLAEAGTGVGQVLAILSVVITSLGPKLILIDEPNSFLHPGAAKRLLSTFAEDSKHQYVITTHSLETLKWFDPEVVLLLKPNGDVTDIEPHSWRDLLSSRVFMSELGISYGDVTGADYCIWVEGQTEAEIFPQVARSFFKNRANTLAFPRVGSTGHFERRSKLSKEEIIEIYDNLSKAVTLLPDTLAFVFDREARSDSDRADLKRRMKEKVEYLPRYCFENYLLDWEAIAKTLNEKPTFQVTPKNPADIEAWVAAKMADRKYWPNGIAAKPLTDDTWRFDIRAADLLADMFADLSGGKEKYQKTVDSVGIAKWLLERRPEVFKEIADIIERFLPKAAAR